MAATWSTYHEGYFLAATELWLAARSNARLAEALAPKEQALGGAIRSAIDEMLGPELTMRPGYVDLREILNTSTRGVALSYAFDPRDPSLDPHVGMCKRSRVESSTRDAATVTIRAGLTSLPFGIDSRPRRLRRAQPIEHCADHEADEWDPDRDQHE